MNDDSDLRGVRLLRRAVFPAERSSVAAVRRWVRGLVADHPRADDAVLLVSELVTNSIVHTRSAAVGVVVLFEEDGGLQVEVVDEGGEAGPCVRARSSGEPPESGHGLRLLRALADQWGFSEERPHRVVWFAFAPGGAHTMSTSACGRPPESRG
ncbi:ATP-binding protein [Microbispora sp. NBC_01189]|uniref:ATP-binding protein n=1 Tax=Microbispora sp. NBC_01189 TaxID=2903583 RepID=UPI002E0FB143|nr:ATP-binding protein [Microbispora sp. NBC_01189]